MLAHGWCLSERRQGKEEEKEQEDEEDEEDR